MATYAFPAITPSSSTWELVSNTATSRSPLSGAVQTLDRGGEFWKVRMTFQNLTAAEKDQLQAFMVKMNGQQHRFSLRDHAYAQRGSVTTTEMVDVTFNATLWESGLPAYGVLSDIDRGVRWKYATNANAGILHPTTSADGISTPTVGLSYAGICQTGEMIEGANSAGALSTNIHWRATNWGASHGVSPGNTESASRLVAYTTCPATDEMYLRPTSNSGNALNKGSTIDYESLSASRCFMVDNGQNRFTYSEQFDDSAWTKQRATISANAATAPDGTTTADELVEDATASNSHLALQSITRSSAVGTWTGSVYIRENTSSRLRLVVDDGTGSNYGMATFNANDGTISLAASDTGTVTQTIASIHDAGDGWYRCRVSTRLPATTSARLLLTLCDGASNDTIFTGDGSSGLYIWGGQLQQGGQLGRYVTTTTTGTSGTTQAGAGVWLKGLDADTDGQLLPGDQVEIDGHLYQLTADLDGDESGCGYAQVRPRIYSAPADEQAAIIYQPHGTFMLAGPTSGWSNAPGDFGTFTIDCISDIVA